MNNTHDWNQLLSFESWDLLKRFGQKKFGKELSNEKIQEIASNFAQGREYFRSAWNAHFTVRPLLQYYGVVALSRGLILALDYGIRETHFKGSHGLDVTNMKSIMASRDFENFNIKIQNGMFFDLLEATDNKNYLRANANGVNYQTQLKAPKQGDSITLEQLIQYYPDLASEFHSWLEYELIYAEFQDYTDVNNLIKVKLGRKISTDTLEKLFPADFCPNRTLKDNMVSFERKDWFPNVTQKWQGAFDIGEACVVPVLKDDIGLNLISGMFMLSYVFGMMARYYPTTWISLMRGGEGDKVYPFIYKTLHFIDEKYPKVVLDFLHSPYEFEIK